MQTKLFSLLTIREENGCQKKKIENLLTLVIIHQYTSIITFSSLGTDPCTMEVAK